MLTTKQFLLYHKSQGLRVIFTSVLLNGHVRKNKTRQTKNLETQTYGIQIQTTFVK